MNDAPAHLSYSSRDTWQRCPKAYQLSRIIKAPQQVAWWNVGGSTVHAVLDAWDEREAGGTLDGFSLQYAWSLLFSDQIAEAEKTEPDRSKWRVKRMSHENEAWWNHHGPIMCQSYIDWRERSPSWRLAEIDGPLAIELDATTTLPGCDREIKAFVDRIFWDSITETYVGVDFKSGSSMGKEEQFGTYRACLKQVWGIDVVRWATFRVRDNSARKNGKAPGIYSHLNVDGEPQTLEHWTPEYAGHLFAQVSRGIDAKVFLPRLDKHCTVFCDMKAACYAAGGEHSERWDPDHPRHEPPF